jgi:hypothetical protein
MAGNGELLRVLNKLNGANWVNWKFRMEMVLEEKDLWGVVIGEEEEPSSSATPVEKATYKKRQKKALTLIALGVEDSQLSHIRTCKTATEAWTKLVAVHEAKGIANKLLLSDQFRQLKLNAGETLADFCARVEEFASRLDGIDVHKDESEVMLTILGGLPPSYRGLVQALEANPTLTLEQCKARLLHEDTRRPMEGNDTDEGALLTRTDGRNAKPRGGDAKKNLTCHYCKKRGHFKRECRKRIADMQKGEGTNGNHSFTRGDEHANPAVMDYLFVAAEVENGKKESWYVDSGASKHMTNQMASFSQFLPIKPVNVTLGNGAKVKAVGIGRVPVRFATKEGSTGGLLTDVLYVPDLHFNLVSVGKLASNGWNTLFVKDGCFIQDENGKRVGHGV